MIYKKFGDGDEILGAPSRNFKVEFPTREFWLANPDVQVSKGIVWFTDGFKTDQGSSRHPGKYLLSLPALKRTSGGDCKSAYSSLYRHSGSFTSTFVF